MDKKPFWQKTKWKLVMAVIVGTVVWISGGLIGFTEKPSKKPPKAAGKPSPKLIARGKEVYDLYECYNCHKIAGKGGVKRKGPALDGHGAHHAAEELKRRIIDPYAPGTKPTEGFEEEYNEKVMPDYYNEMMTKEELNALVAYLLSLK